MDQILYGVLEAARLTSVGRTKLLEEVASGRLGSVKVGRRRLIPRAALEDWASRLPTDGGQAA